MNCATISECGRYRYDLTRDWSEAGNIFGEYHVGASALWIMLNPSTADADKDDATLRRCIAFSKAAGMSKLVVCNLFAYRATQPADMMSAVNPIGPRNREFLDKHIKARRGPHDLIIVAWGSHGSHACCKDQRNAVLRLLPSEQTKCLSVTASGDPGHPVRLPGNLVPIAYPFPDVWA